MASRAEATKYWQLMVLIITGPCCATELVPCDPNRPQPTFTSFRKKHVLSSTMVPVLLLSTVAS